MSRPQMTSPLLLAMALLIPFIAGDGVSWSADPDAQPEPAVQELGNQAAAETKPEPLPAPLPIVEVLPANEWGSVMLTAPDDAARRWDELLTAMGGNPQALFGSGYRGIVSMAYGYLGLNEDVRHDSAIGLISPGNSDGAKNRARFFQGQEFVLAVPFPNRTRLLGRISDPKVAEQEGVYRTKGLPLIFGNAVDFTTNDSYVFFSANNYENKNDESPPDVRERLHRCTDGPRLAESLSPFAKEALGRADLLFHVGIGAAIRDGVKEASFKWSNYPPAGDVTDAAQLELMQAIEAAMQDFEHGFIGMTANDGFSMQTRMQFKNSPDSPATKLLQQFLPPAGSPEAITGATLSALPARRPLVAVSATTTGKRQFQLVQFLSSIAGREHGFWRNIFGGAGNWTISDFRPTVLMGLFSELIERSDSVKLAVYPNQAGTFGIVVILNAKDPAATIAALRELSDLLVQGLGVADPEKPVVTDAQIRSLVRQLASDEFFVRNRANTRLLLIGQPAVTELNKFRDSDNKELAARVAQLIDTIELGKRDGESQLLKGNLLAEIHPRLTYHVNAEHVGKRSVDVIKMSLPETEAVYQQQLEAIFGSQWNQVRVTSVDRSVVMTIGTVGPLLEETLHNLEQNSPGLALNPALVTLPEDPHRLFTLHAPLGRLGERQEWTGRPAWMPVNLEPTGALTGIGVSADSTSIWTDLHIPVDEIRLIVGKNGSLFW